MPSSPRRAFLETPSTSSLSRFPSLVHRESWQTESPYSAGAGSRLSSLSEKYSLSPDPRAWGSDLSPDFVEPDDAIHNPDAASLSGDNENLRFSLRGLANLGCLALLCIGILALFVGYPIFSSVTNPSGQLHHGGSGDKNSSGVVKLIISASTTLIDMDTPQEAYTKTSSADGTEWHLVFSDEFNTDGRTFYPGDDPYWEAADLHYWATNNLEWYDPAAVTTVDGSLMLTFSQASSHGLNYTGGLLSSWNKFCFTGGILEASVQLPGVNNVVGMWPAIWTMGNLGRAGYGASLEGMWPYTYDACDVGTAPNQTLGGLPVAATINGDTGKGGVLSYLPGQRLSRCTCDGEDHPGPKHNDGTYVGRSAPEIDMFEAQITGEPLTGQVSQSAQFAPFNYAYIWDNTTDNMLISDSSISELNSFVGSVTQQATSVVTRYDDAYISWISDGKPSWTIRAPGLGSDPLVNISARSIPQEPMYMIINLGMSRNFGFVDLDHLIFPNHMRVDYIRVYQNPSAINIGCNPPDFPTNDYIIQHIEAYTNPNLTTWRGDYGQPFPRSSLLDGC
ncbi:glycoside hydrolase family 16 protein [Pluteus cervinus]|uniref:Glycoside hydrolase family 16 protein n=1 Tax=Pluteus cervinus TaxID=181527 RepID=A0ACD3ASB4_9AGAR|nr:glycoside hydrolase family 16 protein [Pluteus cervinus]